MGEEDREGDPQRAHPHHRRPEGAAQGEGWAGPEGARVPCQVPTSLGGCTAQLPQGDEREGGAAAEAAAQAERAGGLRAQPRDAPGHDGRHPGAAGLRRRHRDEGRPGPAEAGAVHSRPEGRGRGAPRGHGPGPPRRHRPRGAAAGRDAAHQRQRRQPARDGDRAQRVQEQPEVHGPGGAGEHAPGAGPQERGGDLRGRAGRQGEAW
mmetsp:Transcript_61325/g.159191  ORF Transcript_61325/g.159191 Transcript_61325/m.159191 type:complete len:207 (-) Transcript_61325:1699-2319(-)